MNPEPREIDEPTASASAGAGAMSGVDSIGG